MLKSFLGLLARCYRLALPYGRLRLFSVLSLIFLNGLLQLVGVSSVFPFFALASEPDRIRNSTFGRWFLHLLPPLGEEGLLVAAGCFSILMLFLAGAGSLISESVRIRYAFGFSHWLREKVLRSYASRDYAFFLRRNSADLNQRVLDIQSFTQYVMLPIGECLTRGVLILLLVIGIFVVQPAIAVGSAIVLGGFYAVVFVLIRPRLRRVAEGLQIHNVGMGREVYQFLHGIKTVLVREKSAFFLQRAFLHSREIGRLQSVIPIYGNGPRYLIEPIAFGGLVSVVVILALGGRPFSDILPNLSVMAFAGYRLIPALQLLYGQLVIMASNHYTLAQLEEEIGIMEKEPTTTVPTSPVKPMDFTAEIRFENVTFVHEGAPSPVLENFSLTIRKNESLGIAGPSGVGKSTLIDLLLGLHRPTSGRILVDGIPLDDSNAGAWHELIGYVPQDIYLLDDTIAANIAFGVDPARVDHASLVEAAGAAQILEFIEKELPMGFLSLVGDRGVRLSGGQRQRIGLARALYHRPRILILDEATSALDGATEEAVMRTVSGLHGKLTMLTVAHRLSTLEGCDHVVSLHKPVHPQEG
jgi:ATP-binding cassette, subfamily B, bacterial PglK